MNNDLKICSKLIIELLEDQCWHDIYEIHYKYRLSPVLIVNSIKILHGKGVILLDEQKIKKIDKLSNIQLAYINFLARTRKPECLKKINLELECGSMVDSKC